MYQVQGITSDSLQTQSFNLSDGTSFQLTIRYMPLQYGWVIKSLVYGDFILNGMRICNNPNMLHQFRNQIPFGLACFTIENREPTQLQDFSAQNSVLYILSAEEVEDYARYLSGQVLS